MAFYKNILCTTALCLTMLNTQAIEVSATTGSDGADTATLQIQVKKLNIALQRAANRVEEIENCNDNGFFFSVPENRCLEIIIPELKYGSSNRSTGTHNFTFDQPFDEIPNVILTIRTSHLAGPARNDNFYPGAYATNITRTGFTAKVNTGSRGVGSFDWVAFTGDVGGGTYVPPPPPTPQPQKPQQPCRGETCNADTGPRGGDNASSSDSRSGPN